MGKKVFDIDRSKEVEQPEIIKEFLTDIRKVYLKYNISIGHKDTYGAFIIGTPYRPEEFDWLSNAMVVGFNKGEKIK